MAAGQRVHVVRVELGKGDAGAGKEDVLLPRRSQETTTVTSFYQWPPPCSQLKFPTKHCPALCAQAEIQSLSLAQLNQGQRTALVSMDARGRGLMSVASSSSLASGVWCPSQAIQVEATGALLVLTRAVQARIDQKERNDLNGA
eukprot:scaffold245036_cov19-Tisochrysis_lutea.AAC.1